MRDERTYKIIGAALEVHRELGCGFLEAVYQEALGREFGLQGVPNRGQPVIEIRYKGEPLDKKYQPDYVCYEEVIVEIKAIAGLSGVEEAQIINYLKATGLKVGLLINFGAKSLEHKRFVNDPQITQIAQKGLQGTGNESKGKSVKSVKSVDQITQTNEDHRGAVGERQAIYHPSNLGNLWKLSARLELSKAIGGTGRLQFKRPVCFEVAFDESEKEFTLECPELNIFLGACTPEDLYKAFCEDINWLWQEYVNCEQSELGEDGMRLRRELQNLLEESAVT